MECFLEPVGNLSMHMSSVCCKELYFRKLQMNMIRDYHMLPTLSKTLFHFMLTDAQTKIELINACFLVSN